VSAGPIAQERAGHVPPRTSISEKERVCAAGAKRGRAYCGRKNKSPERDWKNVTCPECHAARRADEAAGEKK
jgi:hypothetical protein